MPASDGGSPITGYRVTPYIGGTAQTPILTGSAANTYTATGLTNGTAYTFTVAAINGVGTGPGLGRLAGDHARGQRRLRPVRRPASAAPPATRSVALSWTAPASDGGSAITGYRITPSIGGTAQTPILTGLRSDHASASPASRTARPTRSRSPPSMASAPAPTPRPPLRSRRASGTTAPGAPTGVGGSAGDASVALSWTAPASNGGSAITGYRVTPYIGATAQTPVLTGSAATTFTVTGLTNGTAYTFTVAAINAVGTGADSAATAAITPAAATAPGAPTGVGGSAGDASVALSWTAPASDGGSTITGYRVTPYIGATAQSAIQTGSASTQLQRHGSHQRHGLHVQGGRDQLRRNRRRLGRLGCGHACGAEPDPDRERASGRPRMGRLRRAADPERPLGLRVEDQCQPRSVARPVRDDHRGQRVDQRVPHGLLRRRRRTAHGIARHVPRCQLRSRRPPTPRTA